MTTTGSTSRRRPPLGRAGLQALRNYLRGWRGAAVLASIVAVAGIALGWSWLLAAGIAPFLVSVLPCVAMCALGLCRNRLIGRQCATTASQQPMVQVSANGSSEASHQEG